MFIYFHVFVENNPEVADLITRSNESTTNFDRLIDDLCELDWSASLLGWGAYCPSLESKASGQWSREEKHIHINVMELTAIKFGLQTLLQNTKCKHIRITTDSTTAVSYVNAMGGTHSLLCNQITKKAWLWAVKHQNWLSCAHIRGKVNIQADSLSRTFRNNTDWMLNKKGFQNIFKLWKQPVIDLFASRLNKQIDKHVSWKPDPNALFIDAFTFNWHDYFFYAFTPFSLIGRVLQKIRSDKAKGIIIVPCWTTQPWSTKLSSIIIDTPRFLPKRKKPVITPSRQRTKPTSTSSKASAHGMPFVWQSFRRCGVSNETAAALMASWRHTTKRQYHSHQRKWLQFCVSNEVYLLNPTVYQVLDFLTSLFKGNLGYSTINTARAALTASLHPYQEDTTSHPLISRFLKRVQYSKTG
ncbi:uncharacterized protein [Apostichopus japonicus]|uniref:uncharacterized protein n=1 Tax=Stichopus japonicus TaxID=307972 RepID=UPI003AB51C70